MRQLTRPASHPSAPLRRKSPISNISIRSALLASSLLAAGWAHAHNHASTKTELKQFGNLPHAAAAVPAVDNFA
ncbi:MAG: hypothetical protein M3453_07575, partial [Pseudomonadota bacterium]|nr:hypothetical protein [Pseudomonadota bacterium]